MRKLSASSEGHIIDPLRPLIAVASEVFDAHIIPMHQHPRAQLLYAAHGKMRVRLGKATWIVSPRTGVWVPCGMPHQVDASASVSYRSIFVSPRLAQAIPAYHQPITIDALTREIILEATSFGPFYRPNSAESRLLDVLHDRLRRTQPEMLSIPLPNDMRARRICEALLAQPGENHRLETWSHRVGASERTLARLFRNETGITFAEWLRRVRLSLALERMMRGEAVTRIALDLGYATPSAFCAMFRRVLGVSPGQYMASLNKNARHAT